MIRVMIADDHEVLRVGLVALIEADPAMTVVATAADDREALAHLLETTVDVLLLDLSLPQGGGAALLEAVRQDHPGVRVVIFSMYGEDQLALHLLRQGAHAYLCKTRPPEELLRAIRAAAQGRTYLTEDLRRLAVDLPDPGSRQPHATLSAREQQVFLLLIEGRTVTEVAEQLELSKSTVSNHVAHIKEKLGVATVGEIIRYAARAGLLEP